MEDLDRLFALIDMISDPETAKKNAADLKTIRAEKKANTQAFKDAKYANVESEKQLAQISSQREALKASKEDLAKREARLNDKERVLATQVREARRVEKIATTGLEEREKIASEREAWVKKHETAIASKKTSLAEMEADIRSRGTQLASAVQRAQAAG